MSHTYHKSAKIYENVYCSNCHFPIVFVCCNGSMGDYSLKRNGPWDWWMYCSNKACKNHKGQGVFQNRPDWTYREEN